MCSKQNKGASIVSEIKITQDQMRLMHLFEGKTHVRARDCIEDEKYDRVIFVVDEGKAGAAIGKGGVLIKAVQNAIEQNVEIVEHSEDPAKFLTNVLRPKLVREVKINNRDNGTRIATVMVDNNNKALAIGREGRNVSKARLIANRYFGITQVTIEGVGAPTLEM